MFWTYRKPVPQILPEAALARDVYYYRIGAFDSQLYASLIAVGVPLSGILFPNDSQTKWIAVSVWFFLSTAYWFTMGMEMISQIRINVTLDQRMTDSQRTSMQLLYWAVAIAFVYWLLAWALSGKSLYGLYAPAPSYGWAEWLILAHTLFVSTFSIQVFYPLMTDYLQSTGPQRLTIK